MPGGATFPEIDDAVSTVDGGRDDDVKSTVGSKVSAAKFVDNSIHHAVYEISTHSSGRYMTVGRPSGSDFQVTHERVYDFEEEEESLLLTHTTAPGVKDDVPVFFTDNRLQTDAIPPLMLYTGGMKIKPHSITTASKGSRVNLRNMGGRRLNLAERKIVAGQNVNVGLRTTDLVMRLFRNKRHSLNSVMVGIPFSGPRTEEVTTYKGASVAKHSLNFLSSNFVSDSFPDTIRFVARHDDYMIYYDRFGNFIYTPSVFQGKDKSLMSVMSGNVKMDSVIDVANRVIVRGNKIAINDDNEAVLDDIEAQEKDGVVKTTTIGDPVVKTRTAARRSANNYLRLTRRAQGVIQSKGHLFAWDLYPSDVIQYRGPMLRGDSTKKAILEVEHRLHTGESSFQLLSYELGIERILQDYSSRNLKDSGEFIREKMKRVEMGGGDKTNLKVYGFATLRYITGKVGRSNSETEYTLSDTDNDIHSGILIGHRNYNVGNAAGRSAVGTGLTFRLTGGSHSSGTITVSSTTGFPSAGHLIINEAIHVQYTGTTSTTFTGVTVQAPSGASIPGSGLSVRLFRTRGHEMRTVKSIRKRREI